MYRMTRRHFRSKIIALCGATLFAMDAATAAPVGDAAVRPSTASDQLPSGDSGVMRDRLAWERQPIPRSTIIEHVGPESRLVSIRISSGFGWRSDPLNGRGRRHSGLDLPGRTGANVYATGAGRVETAGWVSGYGNLVEIAHANGLRTRYGHLSGMLVSPGSQVGAGQVIGRIGSTGRSTGPHLHYEVRVAGVPTDPRPFMQASQVDYAVHWVPEQQAMPKWNGWSDPAGSQLPQSIIK